MRKKTILSTVSGLMLCNYISVVIAANPSVTTISVTIPGLVQISGLSNITLIPTDFISPILGATTACIYTNVITPLGAYYVTATSANGLAGAFRVVNGGNFITYRAYWNPTSASSQTVLLASGAKTAQQLGRNSTSLTCGGNPNANFNIRFTSAQIAGAPAATYTDTVTLVISPS